MSPKRTVVAPARLVPVMVTAMPPTVVAAGGVAAATTGAGEYSSAASATAPASRARLTDHLPIKLVLVDHRVAVVGMSDPVAPEAGYPVFLLIEHPGFVTIQVTAFEGLWESSRPLTPISAPTGRPGPSDFTDLTEPATRPDEA